MEDASVRMTVDSSQAIAENQKYLRAATETFNILQEKSEAYSHDIQERIKFMEREIELQKESNRLGKEQSISGIQDRYTAGKISTRQRDQLIGKVKEESSGDTQELKELTKLTKQWTSDQRTAINKAERMGTDLTRMLPGMFQADTAGGMIGGISNGLLMGSVVGALAAIAIGKEVKGAMQMEPAMRDYAVLTGRSMLNTRGDVSATKEMNLGKMGILPSQYFASYAQLERAGGGRVNENMLGIMAAEKATGISRSQTSSLLGVERYGEGKVTPLFTYFEKYLPTITKSITEQRAMLPEILQTFSTEATAMMRVTGKVDSAAIAATIAVVGKTFGLTGEPLQMVTGAMRQGMQQSTNPVIQALQFGAMERAMPGKSLWQMEMAMENPLANPKYITEFLDQLKGMTGGGEQYARSIYNVFGQYGVSKNIANQMANGEMTNEDFLKESSKYKETKTGGFRGRAEGVTGELEKVTAEWQGGWERTGFVNVENAVIELRKVLEGFAGAITNVINDVRENQVSVVKNLDDALLEASGTKDEITKIRKATDIYMSRGGGGFINQFQ